MANVYSVQTQTYSQTYARQIVDRTEDGEQDVDLRSIFDDVDWEWTRKAMDWTDCEVLEQVTTDQLDCLRQLPIVPWVGEPLDDQPINELISHTGMVLVAKRGWDYYLVNTEGYTYARYIVKISSALLDVIGFER